MRELRRMAWAAAIAVVFSGSAFAQTTSNTGGNLGSSTSSSLGGQGTLGGNTLGGNQGAASSGTGLSGNQLLQGTALMTTPAPPKITAPYNLTSNTNTVIGATNFLRNSYNNPYYQGFYSNYKSGSNPGGFGSQLGGSTGGQGGQGAQTGRGVTGSVNSQDPGGAIVPLPKQISYSAQLQFQVPIVPSQVVTDIRKDLDRSTMLANPQSIQVIADGPNVTLRGAVKDNDEFRLVESVVRLTPGVREIKNELTYPK